MRNPCYSFNKGGASESVINEETGIFYNEQTADSIIHAVERFELSRGKFDPVKISNSAKKFDRKIFEQQIKDFVDNKCSSFFLILNKL